MGHRAAHGRQGRHQLAELISPRLALLVFAAGCVRCGCWNPTTRYCDCAVRVPAPSEEPGPPDTRPAARLGVLAVVPSGYGASPVVAGAAAAEPPRYKAVDVTREDSGIRM